MKFSGNVLNGTRYKELDFGSDLDHCLDNLDPGFFKGSYVRNGKRNNNNNNNSRIYIAQN